MKERKEKKRNADTKIPGFPDTFAQRKEEDSGFPAKRLSRRIDV
ncbi:hypothetical protein [Bacillus salacetis]|nr:hypothetical protein [Bacillus salacetis]